MSKSKGSLITKNKKIQIPDFEWNPSYFLDRTTVVIGASGTGKTTVVTNIMDILTPFIDQPLIVNTMELANKAYSDIVDPLLIHYRPWLPENKSNSSGGKSRGDDDKKGVYRFLDSLWKRQEMMTAIKGRADNMESLKKLFNRLHSDDRREGNDIITFIEKNKQRALERLKEEYRRQPGDYGQKEKEVQLKFQEMLTLVYKKFIVPNMDYLEKQYNEFSEDEKYSFKYINFNPRILVVFDDCAAELKSFFNRDIFRKMFYQNRHAKITFIICCQDDTDLPPNIKKNAYITIYTEPVSATTNFERKSSGMTKDMQKDMIDQVIPTIFKDEYNKLIYFRNDPKKQRIYYSRPEPPRPFKFGSPAIKKLCNQVRVKESSLDAENPYFTKFKV